MTAAIPVTSRRDRMDLDNAVMCESVAEPVDDRLAVLTMGTATKRGNRILGPLLGIDDPRTSERIAFIGGIRGTAELERLVNSGEAAIAFSMFPTTVEQLMAIADAGQIMPPKSTWFEPKLRSGLVVQTF